MQYGFDDLLLVGAQADLVVIRPSCADVSALPSAGASVIVGYSGAQRGSSQSNSSAASCAIVCLAGEGGRKRRVDDAGARQDPRGNLHALGLADHDRREHERAVVLERGRFRGVMAAGRAATCAGRAAARAAGVAAAGACACAARAAAAAGAAGEPSPWQPRFAPITSTVASSRHRMGSIVGRASRARKPAFDPRASGLG